MSATLPNFADPPTTAPCPPRAKLRASCDECGSAKVKCDRERPSCHRCLSMGVACVYGICRKLGKPRRARAPIATSSSGPLSAPAFTAIDPDFWTFDPFWDPALDTAGINTPSLEPDFDGLADSTSRTGSTAQPAPASRYSPTMHMPTPAPSSLPDSSHLGHSCPRSCSTNGGGTNCFQQALDILSGLQDGAPPSEASVSRHTTAYQMRTLPLDQLLSLSRATVNRLGPLLACPCAQMSHLMLVIASILTCIVEWYQSALDTTPRDPVRVDCTTENCSLEPELRTASFDGLRANDSRDEGRGTRDQQRSAAERSSLDAAETLPEISIGKFNIEDRQVQALVRTQLLSVEIKRLGQLIWQFGALHASFHALGVPSAGNTRRNLHQWVAFWLRDAHGALANRTRFRLQEMEANELS